MASLTVIGLGGSKNLDKSYSLFSEIYLEVVGGDINDVVFLEDVDELLEQEKILKKSKEEFNDKLAAHLLVHKPNSILALGEKASLLLGGSRNLAKTRGVVQTMKTDLGFGGYFVAAYSNEEVKQAPRNLTIWAKDIEKIYNISKGITNSISPTKLVYCDTFEKIRTAIGYVKQAGIASFDYETPKIDAEKGTFKEGHHATMVSFSFQAGSGYAIPLEHKDSPFDFKEVRQIMELLRTEIFENPSIRKIAHNLNYDAHINRLYAIKLRGRIDDTMLMHHLYDETKRHGLKDLVSEFYPEYSGYDDELKGFHWDNIPIMILAQYNVTDTDFTFRLAVALESYLLEDPSVYRIYRNLTMAAFKGLFRAEVNGMEVDPQHLTASIKEVKGLIQRRKVKLNGNKVVKRYIDAKVTKSVDDAIADVTEKRRKRRLASVALSEKNGTAYKPTKTEEGYDKKLVELKSGELVPYAGFNYGSWQQLEDLLYYHNYGFKFRTLTGGTGKDIIKALDDSTGFIANLLIYRSLKKVLGTYLEGLQKRMDANYMIHTSFKLHGTVSGRLSSANPNLQNIPNVAKLRDEELIHVVGMVKKSFIVPKGYTLYQYDYSQAELRTIASFANEQNMLGAYARGEDLHAVTAAGMLEVTLKEFYELPKERQKEARSKAKAVNFGLIYAMGAEGFMEYAKNEYGLILTLEESTALRDKFFDTYPKLLDYHDKYIAKGKKFGWVRTLYGRRRRVPNINDPENYIAAMDERAAINSPIQGTSGEFMIFSIALLYHRLDPRVLLVNTVHDSIIFYVPDDMQEYATDIIKTTMENLPNMQYFGKEMKNVSMVTDVEASKESWKDLKELE